MLGAASWGSLALAALCSAVAAFQLGSQPARFTSASVVPLALEAERASEAIVPAPPSRRCRSS